MRSAMRLTMTHSEREQFIKDAQRIVLGGSPALAPVDDVRWQGDLSVKMATEIARRWEDLGLDYVDACELYNADVMQAIYLQKLENVGILKRWIHARSCEKWERNNPDVMRFMSQLN